MLSLLNKWVCGALAIGLLMAGSYHHGKASCETKNALANAAETQKVIITERKSADINTGVSNVYQKNVAAIAAEYDSVPTSTDKNLSTVPQSTGGHNAAPRADKLPQGVQEVLLKSLRRCEIQTARLTACQSWIKDQKANQVQ